MRGAQSLGPFPPGLIPSGVGDSAKQREGIEPIAMFLEVSAKLPGPSTRRFPLQLLEALERAAKRGSLEGEDEVVSDARAGARSLEILPLILGERRFAQLVELRHPAQVDEEGIQPDRAARSIRAGVVRQSGQQ